MKSGTLANLILVIFILGGCTWLVLLGWSAWWYVFAIFLLSIITLEND